MTIKVRIVQLGKGVFDYAADEGVTVEQGLQAAGISADRMEVRVRGRRTPLTERLRDGDLVTVIPLIKGGHVDTVAPALPGHERRGGTR